MSQGPPPALNQKSKKSRIHWINIYIWQIKIKFADDGPKSYLVHAADLCAKISTDEGTGENVSKFGYQLNIIKMFNTCVGLLSQSIVPLQGYAKIAQLVRKDCNVKGIGVIRILVISLSDEVDQI